MLGLASVSKWDTRLEMAFGWLVILAVGLVLLAEHLKTFGKSLASLALFIPASWLVFSLRQENNLLWGWQFQITLCSLTFCGSMAVLSRPLTLWRLAAAISLAVVCTFSFSAGLACWPAGLVLLGVRWADASVQLRRTLLRAGAGWLAASVVAFGMYLHGYVKPGAHPSPTLFLQHPLLALQRFLIQLGGTLATENTPSESTAMGVGLSLIALVLLVAALRRVIDLERAAFGVSLVAFAAAGAAMVTVGRTGLDEVGQLLGSPSRYTTLTLLGIVGLFRVAFCLRPQALKAQLLTALSVLVFIGTFVSLDTEFARGAYSAGEREHLRVILLDWRQRPDSDLKDLYPVPEAVRERAVVLERLHTSVFREKQPAQ